MLLTRQQHRGTAGHEARSILSLCTCCTIVCVCPFYLFVNMSVNNVAGARLFSLWLCSLMSLMTAKLKVPLLVPEGRRSEFDSLTALISVLDTNSGTDAPGQFLVSLELSITACWQVALWHSVSWLTGWQSGSSSSIDYWDFKRQGISHTWIYWEVKSNESWRFYKQICSEKETVMKLTDGCMATCRTSQSLDGRRKMVT